MRFFKIESTAELPYALADGFNIQGCDLSVFGRNEEHMRKVFELKQGRDPAGLFIATGGKEWPDFLRCDFSFSTFFSQRVVDGFESLGFEPHTKIKMPMGKIASKRMQKIPHPDYYLLGANLGIRPAWKEMGYEVDSDGDRLPGELELDFLEKRILDSASWDGSPVFTLDLGFRPSKLVGSLYCTEDVKDLAEKEGWTNAVFDEMKTI